MTYNTTKRDFRGVELSFEGILDVTGEASSSLLILAVFHFHVHFKKFQNSKKTFYY